MRDWDDEVDGASRRKKTKKTKTTSEWRSSEKNGEGWGNGQVGSPDETLA
jgi:hypothetical protein